MFTIILLIVNLAFTAMAVYFTVESIREKERRAPKVGAALTVMGLLLAVLILAAPPLRTPIAIFWGLVILAGGLCLIPKAPNPRTLEGSSGWIVGDVERFDERDIVFARNRSLRPGSDEYKAYYEMHPELEEKDAKRREMGGPLGNPPGRIDNSYMPNVSMIISAFQLPSFLGPHADAPPMPDHPPVDIDPAKATSIVKNYARHLGADIVGVCKVNPLWVYKNRGEIHYDNWEQWGEDINEILPYAVVIATEMDPELVGAGPHTPCAIESAANYAKGAYITTILARWFSIMGYKGAADHSRHYRSLMAPLAVDAGLGEVGRQGYVLAPKFGARVRVFACLTDMPLVPDKPISIGADEFCQACLKCAETCPSRSIPLGEKTVFNGIEKWKLNAETCFAFWGRVGTDCSLCMGICPFSRPNTPLHNLVRWFVANTWAGKKMFPHIDNWLYGKKWRPKKAPDWVDYPKSPDSQTEIYGLEESEKIAKELG